MNFQDIVDKNKEQLEILKEIEEFIETVRIAKRVCITINSSLFRNCMKNSMAGSDLFNHSNNLYSQLREELIAIDGFYLKDTISKIRNIYSNEIIERNLESLENCYKEILKFKKVTKSEEKVEIFKDCVLTLDNIIVNFNQIKTILEYTSIINKDLNIGVQNPPLRIRSNIENIGNKTFDNIINPIEKIYTQLCMIANINEIEEPINIVRVESGSITINFNGNGKICEVIERVISKFNNFLVRRFTKEGTKINFAESFDLISKEVDLVKEMKAAGIDTSDIENIPKETAINVFKQINLFLFANPDSKINEKQINKAEDVKRLLNNISLLEEVIDNND
jgi:hypothetical protein